MAAHDTLERAKSHLREQLSKSLILTSLENLMKHDGDPDLKRQVRRRYLELTNEDRDNG